MNCAKCKRVIAEGEGAYMAPGGPFCNECGKSKPWRKAAKPRIRKPTLETDFKLDGPVTILGHELDEIVLAEYLKKVDYLRRATGIAIGRDDPLIIQKALQARERIHRHIFKLVNLPYHADSKNEESNKFNEALDDWITEQIGYDKE